MKKWLTINELAEKTGVPHQTIRRYISNHSHHLLMKKEHKSYFIAEESIDTVLRIRELYAEGKNIKEVDNTLANMGIPMNITVEDDEKQVSINMGEALIQLQKDMDEQKKFNEKLLETIQAQNENMSKQQEYMNKQQEYISHTLEKRDQRLIEVLKEGMEARKQIAASEEKEEKEIKKGFWQKLFKL